MDVVVVEWKWLDFLLLMCAHWDVCMNRFRSESTACMCTSPSMIAPATTLACPLLLPCVYVSPFAWLYVSGDECEMIFYTHETDVYMSDTLFSVSHFKVCINNFFVTLINVMALDVDCWLNSFRDFSRPRFFFFSFLLFLMFYVHTSSFYYSSFPILHGNFPQCDSIIYSLSNF